LLPVLLIEVRLDAAWLCVQEMRTLQRACAALSKENDKLEVTSILTFLSPWNGPAVVDSEEFVHKCYLLVQLFKAEDESMF
jgi:hypothetical protein